MTTRGPAAVLIVIGGVAAAWGSLSGLRAALCPPVTPTTPAGACAPLDLLPPGALALMIGVAGAGFVILCVGILLRRRFKTRSLRSS